MCGHLVTFSTKNLLYCASQECPTAPNQKTEMCKYYTKDQSILRPTPVFHVSFLTASPSFLTENPINSWWCHLFCQVPVGNIQEICRSKLFMYFHTFLGMEHLLGIPVPAGYLAAIFLCLPNDVLPWINPIQLFIQGVIIDGSNISETVDRKYDIWTLLLIYHHAINCILLTEQKKGCRSLMG